jgi:membrane protein DedA with SNARE-associated domain
MTDGLGPLALLAIFGFVAFGSIIPVVPTGAAVSGAAVLARSEHQWELVLVVLVGAAGAYLGDIVTYGALRLAGERLARRVGWLRADDPDAALQHLRAGIEKNELRSLLLSRLVPGGRIPVLLAAALGGYPWQRYISAAVLATLLWSLTYTVIGVIGDSLFPDAQVAVIAAVVGAVLVTLLAQLIQRRRRARA